MSGSLFYRSSTTGGMFAVCFQGEDNEAFVMYINSPRCIMIIYLILRGRHHRGDFRVRGEYLWANFDLLHGRATQISFQNETRWAIRRSR